MIRFASYKDFINTEDEKKERLEAGDSMKRLGG